MGDLLMIVNSIPFYANKNDNSKFIFNSTLFVKLHEYFFICALSMHIKAYNDMVTRPSIQEIGGEKTMDKSQSIEDTIMKGYQGNLEKNVANLLKVYIYIFGKRKK